MKKNYLILLITALLTLWMCVTSCGDTRSYCTIGIHSKDGIKSDNIILSSKKSIYSKGDTIGKEALYLEKHTERYYIIDTIVCDY